LFFIKNTCTNSFLFYKFIGNILQAQIAEGYLLDIIISCVLLHCKGYGFKMQRKSKKGLPHNW